jgi:hypothetical protein
MRRYPQVGACEITCTGALPAMFDHKACQTGVWNEPDIRHLYEIRLPACRLRGLEFRDRLITNAEGAPRQVP